MRNLERRGVRACCVDWNRANAGFRSVYGQTHACPDPDADPEAWVRFMVHLAESMKQRPVLIAAADQFVSAMSRHRDTLSRYYVFCAETIDLQAALCTKQSLYEIAGQHGFPIPNTRFITAGEELADFAATARYPCILKPQQAVKWARLPVDHPLHDAKLVRAMSREELVEWYRICGAAYPRCGRTGRDYRTRHGEAGVPVLLFEES